MAGGGGGGRKEDASVLTSANAFAALDALKKKKKKKKAGKEEERKALKPEAAVVAKGEKKEEVLFWTPAPLTSKSWADVEDDDDDDYYATATPLPVGSASAWGVVDSIGEGKKVEEEEEAVEESESEEEDNEELDDELEEEHESQGPVEMKPVAKKPPEVPSVPKDTERQLSKKELKKKGLEELDAVLAELGYTKQETRSQGDSQGAAPEKKENNGEAEMKDGAAGESKTAKKKKKKEKCLKEGKDLQDECQGANAGNGMDKTTEMENAEDEAAVDVKERLKKMASLKKKKSSKEMDAAARAAASEAAARSARLAAAKKKEKAHYNQQPVR